MIFWAIVGGLGASLLLPAMQSLIHGNFEGAAQKKVYALVGAAAAIAAAVGPLLGGFITTYLSWRVAFLLEDVIIIVVLIGVRLVKDVPYTGARRVDVVGAGPVRRGHGRHRAGHPGVAGGRRGGRASCSWSAWSRWARWPTGWSDASVRASRRCSTLSCSTSPLFRLGISGQMLQQIALGGTMIALPIYLQMVLEYNAMEAGLSMAPLSLSMFAIALLAGKKAGQRRPSGIIRAGFALLLLGTLILIPIVPRADSGWYLLVPLLIAGSRAGPAGLPAEQLHAVADLGGARQRGRRRELGRRARSGLSFGLAFAGAIMLATLSFTFTNMAEASDVLPPDTQQTAGRGRAWRRTPR